MITAVGAYSPASDTIKARTKKQQRPPILSDRPRTTSVSSKPSEIMGRQSAGYITYETYTPGRVPGVSVEVQLPRHGASSVSPEDQHTRALRRTYLERCSVHVCIPLCTRVYTTVYTRVHFVLLGSRYMLGKSIPREEMLLS